jgi:hypothetical protein
MPFRLKDLMIDVTTAAGSAVQNEGVFRPCGFNFTIVACQFIHTFPCVWGCTHPASYYTCLNTLPTTFTCPGSLVTDTLGTVTIAENPTLLKERLKTALAAAEAAEASQAQSFQVQTVADADMLESKLTGALEELRARKAELQKQQPAKK